MKQNKLPKDQQKEILGMAKEQRNLEDLQKLVTKLMADLDSLAYKIEKTDDENKKTNLEKKFDNKMNLLISLQQGNFSVKTH